VAGAVASLLLHGRVGLVTQLIATWDVFALCGLGLTWLTIVSTPQRALRARAREQDVSRFAIFVFVVVVASAALFALAFLIRTHSAALRGPVLTAHLLLALVTVASCWTLVHTIFGLRYAHIYYRDGDDPAQHAGGLEFPGQRAPDYFDFAYYSFVIGMTCQVSDVQVTDRRLRRLTLVHGMLAFGFNTIILALLINTVSGLI
jgi:uncharacterized membrane protein